MILRAGRKAISGRAAPSAYRISPIPSTSSASIRSLHHQRYAAPRLFSQVPSPATTPRSCIALQHQRAASGRSRSNRPPTKPPAPATGIEQADQTTKSPWTEEPRHPAPGSQPTPPQEPLQSTPPDEPTQPFRSKLRQESSLEESVSNLEDRVAQLQRHVKGINESTDPPQPTGPLPDLRQGIPSSFNFDPQTSDTSSSFKSQESGPLDLNITEDPNSGGGPRDDSPREAYVSSIDKRRQAFARYMYLAFAGFAVGGFAWLGREWDDEVEAKRHPHTTNGMSPMAWYGRARERLGGQFSHYTEPAFQKLLPEQPAEQRMPYTLVLSLEDLLVHSEWTRQDGYKVAKRPGVDYFIRYLCQYYELVIFTSVQQANGDLILRQLDPFSLCLPLFREATHYINGEHVKDLSYLNRPLSKTIILDTNPAHTSLQPENAIILPKWSGAKGDKSAVDLVALIPFLEYIAGMELPDVRKVLASYRGKHIPTEFNRREVKAREEFSARRGASSSKRPGSGALGSLGSALGLKQPAGAMVIPGEQSPAEAYADGKMLTDQIRERGQRGYLELDKQIKENGEMWLKMRAEEEKKAMDEGMKNMTGGVFGMFRKEE